MIYENIISAAVIFPDLVESVGKILVIGLFLGVLAVVALADRKTMIISDKLVLAALAVSLLSVPFFPEIGLGERMLGICSASLLLLLITLCIPGAFGGGDIKLAGACGVLLGWRYSLLALGIAICTGAGYGAWLLAAGKADRKTRIAFGPFLCLGMAVSLLWGELLLSALFL